MKTLMMIAAAALAFAAPTFADTVGEGVVQMSGPNAVSAPVQLGAANGLPGMDAVSVIRVGVAQSDDDNLALYTLRTGPETVSTQGVQAAPSGQFVTAMGADAQSLSLSDAVAAYFDEVAD